MLSYTRWYRRVVLIFILILYSTPPKKPKRILALSLSIAPAPNSQLSWKVGCWGSWNSLSGADGVEWVVFETYLGWKLYGKEPTMGWLTDIDHSTAMVGALSGGMHGLTLLFMCGFLLFSSATLWLTYFYRLPEENAGIAIATCEEANKEARYETRSATGGGAWAGAQSPAGPRSFTAHVCRLVLGRSCHSWLLPMGMIMMFAGLWCSLVGCLAFYLFVTTDFTHGLEVGGTSGLVRWGPIFEILFCLVLVVLCNFMGGETPLFAEVRSLYFVIFSRFSYISFTTTSVTLGRKLRMLFIVVMFQINRKLWCFPHISCGTKKLITVTEVFVDGNRVGEDVGSVNTVGGATPQMHDWCCIGA